MNPTQAPQPDLQALALAKAIRQQESGGNYNASGDAGTSTGAYQFQPETWKQFSKQILGDENAQMTPENQNAVAYGMIKTWKDQGMGPAQIAAKWNSGSETGWENKVGTTTINGKQIPYNVPQYVQGVVNNFKTIYQQEQQRFGSQGGASLIPTANAEGTMTPVTPEGKSVSGFVGNVFESGANLVGGLASMVAHPIKTAENILGTVAGAAEKPFGVDNADTQKFDAMVGYFKERYGGDSVKDVMGSIGNTFYNDPVGAALDLSTLFDGLGGALNATAKTAKIAELSKVATALQDASRAVNPLVYAGKGVAKAGQITKDVGATTYGKLVGISADEVKELVNNYSAYSKGARQSVNRASVADDFGKAVDEFDEMKGKAGQGYQAIRQTPGEVFVPENFFDTVLGKFGLKLKAEAKKGSDGLPIIGDEGANTYSIIADTTSATRNVADLNAIKEFINNWGDKRVLTYEEFLNMREDLAGLAKYDKMTGIGKTKASQTIAHTLRDEANTTMRPQVKGLQKLDETFGPLANELKQIRKDFMTFRDGEWIFKDNAANKIANALGKGKGELLKRMEEVSPGISQRIKTLKTIESIESAYGIKVGTYAKGVVEFAALAHGNIPAVIATIMTHPEIAVPLLRGLGWTKTQIAPVLAFMRKVIGDEARVRNVLEAAQATSSNGSQDSSKGRVESRPK